MTDSETLNMQTTENTSWSKVLERGETEGCEKLPRKKELLILREKTQRKRRWMEMNFKALIRNVKTVNVIWSPQNCRSLVHPLKIWEGVDLEL